MGGGFYHSTLDVKVPMLLYHFFYQVCIGWYIGAEDDMSFRLQFVMESANEVGSHETSLMMTLFPPWVRKEYVKPCDGTVGEIFVDVRSCVPFDDADVLMFLADTATRCISTPSAFHFKSENVCARLKTGKFTKVMGTAKADFYMESLYRDEYG